VNVLRVPVSPRWLQAFALFVMTLTLLKGIAFPHAWAATHLSFNYDHGFVKRALVGALLHNLDVPALKSYQFLFYLSLAIFVANVGLLLSAFAELHRSVHRGFQLAPLVYASSLAVAYLGNTIGYFDHLGLLVTLFALRIADLERRVIFIAVSFGVLVFVHEAVFVIFLPVALWSVLAAPHGEQRKARRVVAVVTTAMVLGLLTYFVSNATLSRDDALTMFREVEATANFRVDRAAFDVLHRSGLDNLALMSRSWEKAHHWREVGFSLATTLPACVALLVLAVVAMRRAGLRWPGWLFGMATGLSPLALHAVGWDIHRWNSLAITTSFLVVLAVQRSARGEPSEAIAAEPPTSRERPRAALGASHGLPALVVCAIVLNASSDIGFINGSRVEPFPYRRHIAYWEEVAKGVEEFPSRPLVAKRIEKHRLPLQKPASHEARLLRPARIAPRPPR
jgi:hypothetical protein